jgi:GGDEF domain-containing protein
MLSDERVRPWWDFVRKVGANAVIALPLLQSGKSIGALVYHSGECGEFDDELIGLLERIEKNVAHALDSFERKAQRDRAEAATLRASRMYAALSATNEAIMRVASAEELFQQVCDAGINGGNFIGTAVLLPDIDKRWFRVAAFSGPAAANLHNVRIATDEALPEGRGPSGIAFRSGKSWVSNDFMNDPRSGPWHELISAMGMASMAAVPFSRNGHTAGVLICYSSEAGTFDEEIILLLGRLTENVGFALDNFDRAAERTRSQERIHYLATHDALTGLPNRLMFAELLSVTLQSARRYGRKFAVLFVDLDRFKIINDMLGHEAGDTLLQEITARFKQALRTSDTVARLGGDEFVVLAQEINDISEVAAVGAGHAFRARMSRDGEHRHRHVSRRR